MLVTTDWTEGIDGSGVEAYHFHCEECGNEWKDFADEILGVCPKCGYGEHDDFAEWFVEDYMDGDHESALASAGFGTDEDYGCLGSDLDDF